MYICVSVPAFYLINHAITSTRQRKLRGSLLTGSIATGNYALLFYHYVRIIAGGGAGSGYASRFPYGFTFLWTLGSAILVIGGQIRDRGYPEKYYVQNLIIKALSRNKNDDPPPNMNVNNAVENVEMKENFDFATLAADFDSTGIENSQENPIVARSKNIINKLSKLHLEDWNISKEDQSDRTTFYKAICNSVTNECNGENIDPNYANVQCMTKFWYIYLLPSHAIWHLCVFFTHLPLMYSWLAFFEMHGRSGDHC